MRKVWVLLQEDATFMRKLNGHLTLHWICHFPVVIFLYFFFPDTWEKISILYLALVSIYANVAGHLAAWQASRVEVLQQKQMDAQDIPEDAVEGDLAPEA
jgi:hypothetical protein